MTNRKITLAVELEDLIVRKFKDLDVAQKYLERIAKGNLTKREDERSHFCTYFVPYDPVAKEIFLGHHKKAGKWLVNGGHIELGETLRDVLRREINEEWGLDYNDFKIGEPQLLTICPIDNPEKQKCREHFDIWHFIPVDKNNFHPDPEKLAYEFYENRWANYNEALKLFNKDENENQVKGLDFLKENLFK